MKVVMNKKALVSLAALAMLSLVGCGQAPIAPLPVPAPVTNGGFTGSGGGCGSVSTGQNGAYFTSLVNVTQQQQSIPASLNLQFSSQGTQYIGPQPGQQAQVSGCFNWADLPAYFAGFGGGMGQPTQTNLQTAIQMTSQTPVVVQSSQQAAFVSNLVLTGQTSLPAWGSAGYPSTITMRIQQAVLAYGGVLVVSQPAQIFVNGQPMMPTGVQAPAYVTPQQGY